MQAQKQGSPQVSAGEELCGDVVPLGCSCALRSMIDSEQLPHLFASLSQRRPPSAVKYEARVCYDVEKKVYSRCGLLLS